LIVPTVSLRQGCPWWRGIWRKSAAKLWSEVHKLYLRLNLVDEIAKQIKVQNYPKQGK